MKFSQYMTLGDQLATEYLEYLAGLHGGFLKHKEIRRTSKVWKIKTKTSTLQHSKIKMPPQA